MKQYPKYTINFNLKKIEVVIFKIVIVCFWRQLSPVNDGNMSLIINLPFVSL